MKSEHRHELETNWLAHHTAIWLERIQPYNSLIVGGLLALAVLMFAYSYFGGGSSTRQSAAWNSYNEAVEGIQPNLDRLHESADEYPDSPMQHYADITWADGQLAIASQLYILNRTASMEAVNRAIGAYQSLLRETEDERIASRAHYGLGRVYELQNELDKARTEYLAVKGGFAALAAERAKQLEKQDTKDVYAWLATAQGPRRTSPTGPGTPGQRPGFTPGEIELPSSTSATEESAANISVDDLFQGIGETSNKGVIEIPNRYNEGAPGSESLPADKPQSGGAADKATPDNVKPEGAKPPDTQPNGAKEDGAKPKE
jgi:predicted negative regulator of RcsB-dependent stress response